MKEEERIAKVSALEAIKIILESRPDITRFQDQIEMIHAFTKDVLEGKLDMSELN
tara:strand:+ start:410 stop:574 length:165 start_codon:yes stop_codon:yes gene_type:complete